MNDRARIKVTWEMTEAKARECVMRAGGLPSDLSAVQGVIRRSVVRNLVIPGRFIGASRLQDEGYKIVAMEIVSRGESGEVAHAQAEQDDCTAIRDIGEHVVGGFKVYRGPNGFVTVPACLFCGAAVVDPETESTEVTS